MNFSVNIRENQDTKAHLISLSLPEVSMNMKRLFPFKNIGEGSSKWYQKIGVSLTVDAKNTMRGTDTLFFKRETFMNMKNGIKYAVPISTSFQLFNYINVSPSFSLDNIYTGKIIEERVLTVDDNQINETVRKDTIYGFNYPYDFIFSVPFSTKLYGVFNINKGRVKAIRHVISPSYLLIIDPIFVRKCGDFTDTIIMKIKKLNITPITTITSTDTPHQENQVQSALTFPIIWK